MSCIGREGVFGILQGCFAEDWRGEDAGEIDVGSEGVLGVFYFYEAGYWEAPVAALGYWMC